MKKEPNDHYAEWLKDRRAEQPQDDFSDRVMGAVLPEAESRSEAFLFFAKAAVLMLAAAVGIGRYGLLLYFVIFS